MRLFTAIELPAQAVKHLQRLQDSLRAIVPGVRWTSPENLHITLKFLGDTAETLVPNLCEAMQRVVLEPIELHVADFVCFPPRGPIRIIGAGLVGDLDTVGRLFTRLEDAAARLGFPREGRAYHPHITLARARNPMSASLRRTLEEQRFKLDLPGPNFTTSGFTLFESRPSNAGAIYVPLLHRQI